jgi:hypothetical protein
VCVRLCVGEKGKIIQENLVDEGPFFLLHDNNEGPVFADINY